MCREDALKLVSYNLEDKQSESLFLASWHWLGEQAIMKSSTNQDQILIN